MPLFEKLGSTKLKSIKFGQTGGIGDTKPYIVTDINNADKGINNLIYLKFDDGFIRGGTIGALKSSITDTLRISKFLTDFPKGPLFLTKQIGLQLSNPIIETRQLPFPKNKEGILGKIISGTNKLSSLVGGPTRIYNAGINTLAQIPVNNLGGHIVRHGFLPIPDDNNKYIKIVKENNENGNNRLERLYYNFFEQDSTKTNIFANISSNVINDYIGGPNSFYGIGHTKINRTEFTGKRKDIDSAINKITAKDIYLSVLEHVYNANTIFQKYKTKYNENANIEDFKSPKVTNNISSKDHINSITSDNVKYKISGSGLSNLFNNEEENIRQAVQNYIPKTPNTKYNDLIYAKVNKPNITLPISQKDDPNSVIKKKVTDISTYIIRKPNITNPSDVLEYDYNLTKLEEVYNRDDDKIMMVKFSQLDPFKGKILNSINLSSYLSSYNESYNSTWQDIKYNGRSEVFYSFDSYKKTASFKLQIPIFNPNELKTKHENLKLLQKGLADAHLEALGFKI